MPQIVSFHSFRGGTGKSNLAANLAALMAIRGQRVAVVDADIVSPGVYVLFGLDPADLAKGRSLNDYLWSRCRIEETARDVTVSLGHDVKGQVLLIPSNIKASAIARILADGYDVDRLSRGLQELLRVLHLDALLMDTHPGLNQETLLSMAVSDALIIVMRPDQQDYQGTAVTVEVARNLGVPRMMLVVNKVPAAFDREEIRAEVERAYECEVAALLPLSDDIVTLASGGVFVVRYPQHPVTELYKQVLRRLDA